MNIINLSHFSIISEHCPRALLTYHLCHRWADKNFEVIINKREVVNDRSLSWTRLKNDLRALAKEGILEWREKKKCLQITLTTDKAA